MADTNPSLNMNMPVPVVGVDPGPQWASDINSCLTILDSHNHSSGSGVQITPAGLNISSDLAFGGNNAFQLRSIRMNAQAAPLALPADLGCVYVSGVDLYFNDENGNQVRITQSGGVAGTPGSIANLVSPASASYVAGTQTFVWQSAANTPANLDAGSVIFRNISASSNGVTLSAPAALGSDYALTLPAIPASQKIMTLDNAGAMSAPYTVDGSTIAIASNIIGVPAQGISATQILNATITGQQMASSALRMGSSYRNFLYNSAFDVWQRGTTGTAANAASAYVADRWYIKNSLGTNGIITCAQVTGVTAGSKFGASVKISTAPTAAQTNGCEFYQTLDNASSQDLLGRTADLHAQIKALGNVTQVGIQFYYATTETKVTTAIGSEQLVTVNSATFTLGSLLAKAMTFATITASGVIGVRFRIAAVSSGNLYDVNNGYIVEQVSLNISSDYTTYLRQGSCSASELALCQKFYEKSYNLTVNPATATTVGLACLILPVAAGSAQAMAMPIKFRVAKFATPTVKLYDRDGFINGVDINNVGSAGANTGITQYIGQSGFVGGLINPTSTYALSFHWTAESEI